MKDLKSYHAYYVTSLLFLVSCFIFKDMVFFPLACCFLCLGVAKMFKEQGRFANPDTNASQDRQEQLKTQSAAK